MSEKITKDKAANAASSLTTLIMCDGVTQAEKELFKKALAVVWEIHDRTDR